VNARAALPGAEDTIAAVATATGRGALAIVRLSGGSARTIGAAMLEPFHWAAGRTYPAVVHAAGDAAAIDRVMVSVHAAPRSYTGEDTIELTTHGGPLIPALVLDALLAAGARTALPGEFTRRAVANGKMDLLQAEATADLVDARSPAMHRTALHQLDGGLTRRIAALRQQVLGIEALLAYEIDFPEEDEGPAPRERATAQSTALIASLDSLLSSAHAGEIVRDGAVVVLAGAPNSGKSSLFNALLGVARAIVTDVPGTTRDALEAMIELDGWPVRLVDTAGLRDGAADQVERIGIEVAHRYVGHADAVLVCADDADALPRASDRVAALTAAPRVLVRTKIDLVSKRDLNGYPPAIGVSALTGEGLGELTRRIGRLLSAHLPEGEGAAALLMRERHQRGVARARTEVAAFRDAWIAGALPAPVAAVHLRTAADALEELIGIVERDDVLDEVFRSFCIGK
jgi:tRNA modification GTPase